VFALPELPARVTPKVDRARAAAGIERIYPLDFSGEIADAAVQGEQVLAATSDGELWQSGDGTAWTLRSTLPGPALALSAARSPSGVDGVLVLLEDATVHLSEDGGLTWRAMGPKLPVEVGEDPVLATVRRVLSTVALRWVGEGWSVVVSGVSGWTGWSRDGGKTWRTEQLGEDGEIRDISIGGDGQVLMCGSRGMNLHLAASAEVWTSLRIPDKQPWTACVLTSEAKGNIVSVGLRGLAASTRGLSKVWTRLPPTVGSMSDLVVSGGALWGVTEDGAIVRSADGGKRWAVVQRFAGARFDRLMQVNGRTMVALGPHVVVRSVDGGKRWTWGRGEHVAEVFDIDGAGNGHAVAVGRGGRVWTVGPEGVKPSPWSGTTQGVLGSVSVSGGKFVWVASDDGKVYRSEDAGVGFDAVTPADGGHGLTSVLALDALNVFAAGINGELYGSVDRGKVWRSLVGEGGEARPVDLLGLSEDPTRMETRLWAAGDAGTVMVSAGGVQRIEAHRYPGAGAFVDVEATAGRVWLLDGTGMMVRSEGDLKDGLEVLSVPTSWALTRMAFGADGTGVALTTAGALLRTSDGGVRWWLVEHDIDGIVNDLVEVDGAYLMVGHGGVARRSEDGGRTFTRVKTGAGKSLNALVASGGVVYTGGFNGVALTSRDGGVSWSRWEGLAPAMDQMHITALAADGARIAVGGVAELWVLEEGVWTRSTPSPTASTQLGEVRRVVFGAGGEIILLSSNGDIWRRNGAVLTTLAFEDAGHRPMGVVSDMVGTQGRVFASSEGGVFEVRSAGDSASPREQSELVEPLVVDRPTVAPIARLGAQGTRLWLGGPGGLWATDTLKSARQALGTLGSRCQDLTFVDRDRGYAGCDGGVLMATTDGGSTFLPLWSGTRAAINAVHVENDGTVLLGTRAGGIYRKRP